MDFRLSQLDSLLSDFLAMQYALPFVSRHDRSDLLRNIRELRGILVRMDRYFTRPERNTHEIDRSSQSRPK